MNKKTSQLSLLSRIGNYPPILNREIAPFGSPHSTVKTSSSKEGQKKNPLTDSHKSMYNLLGSRVIEPSAQIHGPRSHFSSISGMMKTGASTSTNNNNKSLFQGFQSNSFRALKSEPNEVLLLKRDANQKSKTVVYSETKRRRDSDFSSAFARNDGMSSPMEGSDSASWCRSPRRNEGITQEALVLSLARQSLDTIGTKLERNFERLKEGVGISLAALEEEARDNGKNEFSLRKQGDVMEQLVELIADASRNELKLSQSGALSAEKQGQISMQKRKLDQVLKQLSHNNTENKRLVDINEHLEKDLIDKSRQITQQEKTIQQDKRRIEQLEKRIELLLDTSFISYAQQKSRQIPNNFNTSLDGNGSISLQLSPKNNNNNTTTKPSIDSGNLRIMMSEMIRENESLRKRVSVLEADVSRSKESESKLQVTVNQLQKKLEAIKKKISEQDLEAIQYEEKKLQNQIKQEKSHKSNQSSLINHLMIPKDADYRLSNIKLEFSQILMDIIEHGSSKFAVHVSKNKSIEKRTKLISLLASQFISYREFSNRFLDSIRQIHGLFLSQDLAAIQQQVSDNFPSFFKARVCRLWINNISTGIMYAIGKDQKRIVCIPGKGVFNDVFQSKQIINVKNQVVERGYLYIGMNESEDSNSLLASQMVDLNHQLEQSSQYFHQNSQNSLCSPIIVNDQVIGILEISECTHSEGYGQDEELFAVLCSNFFGIILSSLKSHREDLINSKYQHILKSSFERSVAAPGLLALEKTIRQSLRDDFGISLFRFFFVKSSWYNASQKDLFKQDQTATSQSQLTKKILHSQDNEYLMYSLVEKSSFNYKKGVIGETIVKGKPIFSGIIQSEPAYDPFVDLKTQLPTLSLPLMIQSEDQLQQTCVGVIQVPLRKRTRIAKEHDELQLGTTPLLGIDSSLESILISYSKLMASAVQFHLLFQSRQQGKEQ